MVSNTQQSPPVSGLVPSSMSLRQIEKYDYPRGVKAAEEGFGMEIYNVSPCPNG